MKKKKKKQHIIPLVIFCCIKLHLHSLDTTNITQTLWCCLKENEQLVIQWKKADIFSKGEIGHV